ncbi:MAG: hypothetical protein RBS84_03510 [Kiritimatiellia bacterium]|jgi:hypothetical protein|nr:hypothetical protein [Kiritimatiellia bacterium]
MKREESGPVAMFNNQQVIRRLRAFASIATFALKDRPTINT